MTRTTGPIHIGIAGCSAEGAALCYRTICQDGARLLGPYNHPEVTMHTPPLAQYVDCLERGDMPGVAQLMLASVDVLKRAGAELVICPDNTIHQAFDAVIESSALPWIHIADAVGEAAGQEGFRQLGILGTRWLMDSDVYPARLCPRGIASQVPGPAEREALNGIIMDELVNDRQHPQSVERIVAMIDGLRDAGCDAVVLGCTELPLVINAGNSPLPVLDSTRLLARAALQRAVRAD